MPIRTPIIRPGRNAWRLERASRVKVLVDAAQYFETLAAVLERARRQVVIVGWDIHSRIRLTRNGAEDDDPHATRLGDLLDRIARERPKLQVYVLDWDFAVIYLPEREMLPVYNLGWKTHERVHFRLDDQCPPGASHHQKIVVVDDAVAFAGGIDLAACRWDTREHLARDARRTAPNGSTYGPFHDLQMMVDGDAASALGDLVRERWRRSGAKALRRPGDSSDPWPPRVAPDFTSVAVAVARTEPPFQGRPAVREVAALTRDAIRAARNTLYMENQYFTSPDVGDSIIEKLQDPEGPEIVLVIPIRLSGWLEEVSMGVLFQRLLDRIRQADRYERFRVYYPVAETDADEEEPIKVHAKMMVVDDRLLCIGSSNLTSRSMGLDTECNLAVESRDAETSHFFLRFRNDLLAEHLGVAPDAFASALERHGGMIAAVEALRGRGKTLVPVAAKVSAWMEAVAPPGDLIDPERPIAFERLVAEMLPEDEHEAPRFPLGRFALAALALAGLAVLWRWTPLSQWADPSSLLDLAEPFRESPWSLPAAFVAFLLGGMLLFPITALILLAGLLFGPWIGFSLAMGGSLASAAATFWIGRALGRNTVRTISGKRLNRISRWLNKQGIVVVAVLRMVPIAPFAVVNVVAGVTHLRFRTYLAGTLLGMAPGALAITVFADRLSHALRDPSGGSVAFMGALLVLIVGASLWLRRRVSRWTQKGGEREDGAA